MRSKKLEGRFARVDDIPFVLPVKTRDSPAFMAAFSIDPDRARELLPGNELHPVRLFRRALLLITVIDYKDTPIGKYIEFSIGIPCTRGWRGAPPLLPLLLKGVFNFGQYVYDLPVSTEISVKGGKGIWGMPKHQANLDFRVDDRKVSSQYDLDGQLAMHIEIDRPHGVVLPARITAVNFCAFRGMLMKSTVRVKTGVCLAPPGRARAKLTIGNHPRLLPLKELEIGTRPVFTAFFPAISGSLDDHVEGWFLSEDRLPEKAPGLETVVHLGLGEEWLEPPVRADVPRQPEETPEAAHTPR